MLEDCIKRYRLGGMTFEEIAQRASAYIESMRKEAAEAAETRMEYYDEE